MNIWKKDEKKEDCVHTSMHKITQKVCSVVEPNGNDAKWGLAHTAYLLLLLLLFVHFLFLSCTTQHKYMLMHVLFFYRFVLRMHLSLFDHNAFMFIWFFYENHIKFVSFFYWKSTVCCCCRFFVELFKV